MESLKPSCPKIQQKQKFLEFRLKIAIRQAQAGPGNAVFIFFAIFFFVELYFVAFFLLVWTSTSQPGLLHEYDQGV